MTLVPSDRSIASTSDSGSGEAGDSLTTPISTWPAEPKVTPMMTMIITGSTVMKNGAGSGRAAGGA